MPVRGVAVSSRPSNCRYCVAGFLAEAHVVDSLVANGVTVTDVKANEAVKVNVLKAVQDNDPVYFTGFGHGNAGVFTGDDEQPILDLSNVALMKGRVVSLLSCLTAQQLGPALIQAGALAYIGYYEEWTWIQEDLSQDPYVDRYAASYYKSHDEQGYHLGPGGNVQDAKDGMLAMYNTEISKWLGSSDPYASDMVMWLVWDRDALRVLGDMTATITGPAVEEKLEQVKMAGYRTWSKKVRVRPEPLKDMEVAGMPDQVQPAMQYKLHATDKETGEVLTGARATLDDVEQGFTDTNGDVWITVPATAEAPRAAGMGKVTIEIEAQTDSDPYQRFIGLGMDQELTGEWWKNPDLVIGLGQYYFYWVKDFDLAPGVHNLYTSVSLTAQGYSWHFKVWINGELKGEKDVGPNDSMWVSFKVGEEPKTVTARLTMAGYNPWQKTSEVVPLPEREMEVAGMPDEAARGELIEIAVTDKETGGALVGAEVTEDEATVAHTDESGHASWLFAEEG